MPELLTQEDGDVDSDDDDDNDDDDDDDDGGDVAADVGDAPATVEAATPAEALLLVDATNGFNNLSRYGMLWTVRHRCPKMSRFTFNCYRHEITLICRQPGGEVETILSKEGVTQGDPLAMALYGIALLPLADLLRKEYLDVLQP